MLSACLVQRTAVVLPAASVRAASKAEADHLIIRDAQRHESDAFGLASRQRFVGQKMVARLGEAAEQRPDDDGMIARRDAEPRMAVENSRILGGDRHIGQQRDGKAGAHRNCRESPRPPASNN